MSLSRIAAVRAASLAIAHRSVVATLIAAAAALPAFAEGTPQQRRACTPDVMRLCKAEIPDHARITACLIAKRSNLSEACAMVMFPTHQSEARIPGFRADAAIAN
jgi:hypothetical protein